MRRHESDDLEEKRVVGQIVSRPTDRQRDSGRSRSQDSMLVVWWAHDSRVWLRPTVIQAGFSAVRGENYAHD